MKELDYHIENLKKLDDELKEITKQLAEEINSGYDGEAFRLLKLVCDYIDKPIVLVTDDGTIKYKNKLANSSIRKILKNKKTLLDRAMKSKKIVTQSLNISDDYKRVTCIPLIFDGVAGAICILRN